MRIFLQDLQWIKPIWCLGLMGLFLIGTTNTVSAQRITLDRENHEVFLQQVNEMFKDVERINRTEAQQVIDSFSTLWLSERLSRQQRETIFNTLESMQPLRLRPWPDQGSYFKGILLMFASTAPASNFENWHKSFAPLLNLQNQRRLLRYWETTNNLLETNIFFASNVMRWQFQNNNFQLDFKDETAMVVFNGGDIKCYTQDDSTTIYNAKGIYFPMQDRFTGNGGRITWERAAMPANEVYANLGRYTIEMGSTRWEADSVTFFNTRFFKEPLQGKIIERIIAETNQENARYPRFESYRSIHEIKNLFPGIDFRGGFTLAGARVIGSGTAEEEATINIFRSDSLFITARGRSFSIHSDRIVTQRAAVSIYLSGDSIFHPNISMRYTNPTREFSMLRDEKGFSRAPFSNSFHKIDMFCEAIYWNIDTYEIQMRMIRSISETGQAFFESQDYFSDVRYMRMQGMSQLHPLIRLRNFARDYKSNTFFIAEYAKYVRADVASVANQLLAFSQDGFLAYNEEDETVTLQEKLFHYITAYTGRSDFDVIRINSAAPVNARLNMNNFDLQLFGVEQIPLSNKKNVVIHPRNQQVIMKKNRDIYFEGRIESGLFDFYGKEFFFNYDAFKIDLLQTDSMSFRVRSFEADSRGQYSLVRVRTVLEGINGELLVDHPRNKSGQLPYPRFPIFSSNNESYVYYDRDEVQKGVYKRDDVFFRLIPFSIDSLDNATTDNIAFDGVFISTGIFPDFYDYLRVQPDYSLGFNTKTPDDGYTVYGGKALYKGPINMSYEGLRADGELQYLNATVFANQMLMFPDSARATLNTFNLAAQRLPVEYPEINAMDVNMLYLPHQDNMALRNTKQPFDVYGGLAMLRGSVNLSPDGLTGKGEMEFFGGKLLSEEIEFKLSDFESEKATLALMAANSDNLAINAVNYNVKVDFEEKTSKLTNIERQSRLDFTISRYQAFGFDVDWDLEAGFLQMVNDKRDEIELLGQLAPEDWIQYNFTGNELVSTHAAQDKLSFYAGKMDYSLEENVINASEVKIIKVADAAIYPDNGEVEILERAEIKRLENTLIIANTTTQLHRFYDASVNITSRWNYAGSGMYDYTDETGKVQPIAFESISVDRAFHTTIATAQIEQEQDFTISPQFGFFGKANLAAEKASFHYAGAAKIFADCPIYRPNWIRFEAELQKDSVFIPLAEDLRNDANGRINIAMMLAGDSVHVYPAIFDRQRHYSDMAIVSASGFLTWSRENRQYQISSAERLLKSTLPDNIITINPNTCVVEGFGSVTLSQDLGQFKMETYGMVRHQLIENEVELDLVMGVSFYFLNTALGLVESGINKYEELQALNLNRTKYRAFLQKKTNETTANQLIEEFLADGSFRRFPPELNHTFLFADVRMRWNQVQQTFHTTYPIGIGNMERFPMNKYVDGYLEIRKARAGDNFNLILVPSGMPQEGIGTNWYFFHYTKGIMQTISSVTEFNNMIRDVNPRRRRMEVERGEEPFAFMLSSDRRPLDFVRSMRLIQ